MNIINKINKFVSLPRRQAGGEIKSFRFRKPVILAFSLSLLLSAGAAVLFSKAYHKLRQSPNEAVKEEARSLANKVGRLINLPQGEEPTVATVVDVEKLKDQPFFAKAQNGDQVLLYHQAKKAFLYRPRENKIVEVASINLKP